MPKHAPIKLVAIGGGTGLSTLLKGFKRYIIPREEKITLTAIVTMTDDGKSSGRLRGEFSILPPGDIRNCLVALANDDHLITKLFNHRFPGDGQLGGHSLGNLLILALNQLSSNFLTAIDQARAMLGINARVLPSTLDKVDLVAKVGTMTLRGQVAIKSYQAPIHEISLMPPMATALPEAIDAILAADLITLGPGSLFTSVIATLLIKDLVHAIAESRAKKIYICNAMTEFDETDGYTAVDHVRRLLNYAPGMQLDYALFNSAPISAEMRERYAHEKAIALDPPSSVPSDLQGIRFICLPLASESRFVRHDCNKLSEAILEIYSR